MPLFENATLSTTVVLAVLICLVIYVYVRWSQMPPGPVGLPYLGYYPFLSEDYYRELPQMTNIYGKVFCFTVTGQLYAHVCDLKTIREVTITKSDSFSKKPTTFTLFRDIFEGGVLFSNEKEWKVLRKFFLMKFKEFGLGTKTQEDIMQDYLKEIVNSLNKSNGNEFGATDFFSEVANNVIRRLLFGDTKLDENDIQLFNEAYSNITKFSIDRKILLAGPILKYILIPFVSEYRNYRKGKAQVDSIMGRFIRQHEKEFDRNNIRNLVDAFLNERELLLENHDPDAKFFTERCLVASLLQFIGDGTMGVGIIAGAILRRLSAYPDVQKAIQSEIDEAVGRNRLPSLDDKSKLSYTSAAIQEATRFIKFIPLLPSMECTKETTLGGCRIPKGTIVLYNLWAAWHDAEQYDEPFKFDPTRFLSVDGKNPRCEIPFFFGIGKRSCTSESMVSMQLLLYIVTVFQHFDLHPAEEKESEAEELNFFIKATPRAL